MSREFHSKEDSHSTKLEQMLQKFVKLSFREFCGSKLSGLHPLDNMAIIHLVKNRLRTEIPWKYLHHQKCLHGHTSMRSMV